MTTSDDDARDVPLVIIGGGLSGLAVGLRLQATGFTDFVILERAGDVGGVWRDNTYPGVGVDTPSAIYSLATHPNPHWSSSYATGPELQHYVGWVAASSGLRDHVRFHHEVLDASWDAAARRWTVTTSRATFRARVLVSAAGFLADPAVPRIPGLAEFPGTVFHSARWDHDHDLRGRTVAVVGTGASSVQFVPEIAREAGALHVLQRTPAWVVPKRAVARSARVRRLRARLPVLMTLDRLRSSVLVEVFASARRFAGLRRSFETMGREHLARQVPDPALRARLSPDFGFMCKRPLVSDAYLATFTREHVHLHTGGLVAVEGDELVAGDGSRVRADTLILNTGFETGVASPIARRLHGTGGVRLADVWGEQPRAYKGMAVPGFPNLFLVQGPNATSGVASSLVFAEAQAVYIADAVRHLARTGTEVVEVDAGAERRWTRRVRRLSARTVYETGGCASYYQNARGENVVMWPASTPEYLLRTRRFDAGAYHLTPARAPHESVPA